MGDWDCDGEQTPAMYRRSQGYMYLRNENTEGVADFGFYFGNPGDVPLAGDFDGDGCDTLSIYRPSEQRFYISNSLDNRVAEYSFVFGNPGDRPFVGDFDGDGVDTIGLHRPSTGLVYFRDTNSSGIADRSFIFGDPGDVVFAGDWDGDGVDTVAAYRRSNGMLYLRNTHRAGVADAQLLVGSFRYAMPVAGVESIVGGTVVVPGFDPPPPRRASGPISISGESGVVIEGLHVSNPDGPCIQVTFSANVTIRNTTIGPCGGPGVYLSDVDGATVVGNYVMDSSRGVLAHRSTSVRVDSNTFLDAGRNFVQFDKVDGPGSSISFNRGQNALGDSEAEDLINLFQSNGTPGSPILVEGNRLRYGGPSRSGSGILLGDGGGSHQVARGNRLVDPGQVGIGVAGGYDMRVVDNLVYGEAHSWSNVGIYAMDFSGGCDGVEIARNRVNWTAAGGYSNGFFDGGSCSNLAVYDNDWNADIGPEIF
ncbi:MAG TPA: right-handed parallel beta-helix repeat-containing protein [Actinobacteria bacterium]|nr:right-handed parallel beta-helix repeat-containing protein [Actinomycetota bacterium]